MILAFLLAAIAATPEELTRLAEELAARPQGDDLMLEISDMVDDAPAEEKPALEAAMKLATLLDREAEPLTVEERLLFYKPVMTGSSADRDRVLKNARSGVIPAAPLLEALHLELAVMGPKERVVLLEKWKARPFDSQSETRVQNAHAVAVAIQDDDLGSLEVARKLATALGNPPPKTIEIDFESYPDELADLKPSERAPRIEAALSGVEPADQPRLESALNVARAIADEDLEKKRVVFLFQTALSDDPDIRFRAMEAASRATKPTPKPEPTPEPKPETPEEAFARLHEEKAELLDQYQSRRLRLVQETELHMRSVGTAMTWNESVVWFPEQGTTRLTGLEWAELVDPAVEERILKRPKKGKVWLVLGTAVGLGSLALVPPAVVGFQNEDWPLAVTSTTGAGFGLAGATSMIVIGNYLQNTSRPNAHQFYRLNDEKPQRLADEHNRKVAEEIGLTEDDLKYFGD